MQEQEGKGWISEKEEEDANMETTIDIVYKNLFLFGKCRMAAGKKIEENNRTQTYPRPQRRGG